MKFIEPFNVKKALWIGSGLMLLFVGSLVQYSLQSQIWVFVLYGLAIILVIKGVMIDDGDNDGPRDRRVLR